MNLYNINIEKELQIVFMGIPSFAVSILEVLIDNYKVRAVVTQPDIKGNRGEIKYSPVKEVALKNMILTLQPERIKDEYEEIIDLHPDLIITCAYGQILPKKLLDAPRFGCINVHASLPPKLKGELLYISIINGNKKLTNRNDSKYQFLFYLVNL